jgi:NADPH-dependent glutamate synthase beta subunit-like oxidoreductase
MGHDVTVYEKRRHPGGMLRYGIPSYRLPRASLQWDIDAILSTGVQLKLEADVGGEIVIETLRDQYDAIFIAIGAHTEKKLGLAGEDLRGVMSAVQILRAAGDGETPVFKDKRVIVVGGGNVAMDAARTLVRLGAAKVSIVYRRRQEDMTASPDEVQAAVAEGCEIMPLQSPVKIEGAGENVAALLTQPQIAGPVENGRPKPLDAELPENRIPCDILVLAVGQDIDAAPFEKQGVKTKRNLIQTQPDGGIEGMPGVFAGGDCASGPATVIRAIAAGKAAAANIDRFLGFHHTISIDVAIPPPGSADKKKWGRVNPRERNSQERKTDFENVELGMSCEEARQEAGRCLRCDRCGYGTFRGGRNAQW